jgi:hypothetical protein
VASDTQGTQDRPVGGPRPGRTDGAAGRGSGGVGHAVPAGCRPTVLDEHRHVRARRSAASLRGDVVGTDQIPVPLESAMGTAEPPAPGLGDPPPAGGTGGGGATLIHQPHHDPGLLSLVAQGLEQVGAAPLPQPEVLHPPGVLAGDALEVAHDQGPDLLVVDGEGDHLLGRLMLGLMDAAAMARLGPTHPSPMPAPAPRSALPCGDWRPGTRRRRSAGAPTEPRSPTAPRMIPRWSTLDRVPDSC